MAVFTRNVRKHIFVHPGDHQKLHNAVKMALMMGKKKYSDSLEGALLDVSNIKVIGNRHLVVKGYLSMEVVADFEVFAPTIGMTLEGVIHKVNRGHFGCLVLNLFNASLSLPESSECQPKEGDSCTFTVTQLVVNGDLFFIRGQLERLFPTESSSTTISQYLEDENKESDLSFVKVKVEKEESRVLDNDSSIPETIMSKKRKKESSCQDHSNLSESPNKQKKKKKDKKESSEEVLNNPENHNNYSNVKIKQELESDHPTYPNGETLGSSKKHKKKHKVKAEGVEIASSSSHSPTNSLENTNTVPDINNIIIKREKDLDDSSYGDNDNSKSIKSTKKHKKKHREDMDSFDDSTNSSIMTIVASGDFNAVIKKEKTDDENSKKNQKKKRKSRCNGDTIEEDTLPTLAENTFIKKVKTEPVSPHKKAKKSHREKD